MVEKLRFIHIMLAIPEQIHYTINSEGRILPLVSQFTEPLQWIAGQIVNTYLDNYAAPRKVARGLRAVHNLGCAFIS